MKNLLVLVAVALMGAGGIAPYPTGNVNRVSVQGTTGPTGATGPQGPAGVGSMADGGIIQGSLTVTGITYTDGGICLEPTCTNNLYSFGGFVRTDSNVLASSILAQAGGVSTNSGGLISENNHPVPSIVSLNLDGGAIPGLQMELGECTASSNACPAQALHFSATPMCFCTDQSTTLGACSMTSTSSTSTTPKTFGASDVASWMCIGAR